MGRRHAGHRFMPGKFVFPGGRIEPGDRAMPRRRRALDPRPRRRCMARPCGPPPPAAARWRSPPSARPSRRPACCSARRITARRTRPAGPWAAFARARRAPDLEAAAVRRPRHHAAATAQALRHPLLHDRPRRRRRRGRRRRRPRVRADRARLGLLREAQPLELPTITSIVLDELEHRIDKGFAPELPVPFYYEFARSSCGSCFSPGARHQSLTTMGHSAEIARSGARSVRRNPCVI